jgi:hypothetical protein
MNSSNFFSLVPNFINGVHAIRADLINVAFVIAFAGLVIHICTALIRKDVAHMFPTLVRLAFIPIIIGSLEFWGDLLVGGVQGLISDMGGSGTGSNIFQDYQAAIARKMGTAAAAANSAAFQNQPVPAQPGQAVPSPLPGPTSPQSTNGTILTHYAYAGDTSPDGILRTGLERLTGIRRQDL